MFSQSKSASSSTSSQTTTNQQVAGGSGTSVGGGGYVGGSVVTVNQNLDANVAETAISGVTSASATALDENRIVSEDAMGTVLQAQVNANSIVQNTEDQNNQLLQNVEAGITASNQNSAILAQETLQIAANAAPQTAAAQSEIMAGTSPISSIIGGSSSSSLIMLGAIAIVVYILIKNK